MLSGAGIVPGIRECIPDLKLYCKVLCLQLCWLAERESSGQPLGVPHSAGAQNYIIRTPAALEQCILAGAKAEQGQMHMQQKFRPGCTQYWPDVQKAWAPLLRSWRQLAAGLEAPLHLVYCHCKPQQATGAAKIVDV